MQCPQTLLVAPGQLNIFVETKLHAQADKHHRNFDFLQIFNREVFFEPTISKRILGQHNHRRALAVDEIENLSARVPSEHIILRTIDQIG